MTKAEIIRKYWPLVVGKKVTPKQYEWLINEGKSNLPDSGSETPIAPDGAGSGGNDPRDDGDDFGGDGNHEGIDAVAEAIASRIGGTVTAHPDRGAGRTQKDRLLRILSDGEPHTTPEIAKEVYNRDQAGICRIAARINDLKNEGFRIQSQKIKGSIWQYQLSV